MAYKPYYSATLKFRVRVPSITLAYRALSISVVLFYIRIVPPPPVDRPRSPVIGLRYILLVGILETLLL